MEYKAKPSRIDLPSHDPLADPRTSDILILFEERVPLVSLRISFVTELS